MSASYFSDKTIFPDEARFANALGHSYELYDKIRTFIRDNYGIVTPGWKFYGARSGWVLKMLFKKKNLFFVIPCKGYFRVAFTLGQKGFETLLASDLPDSIKVLWKEATNHTEGRTVQLDVKNDDDCHLVIRHIEIKTGSI